MNATIPSLQKDFGRLVKELPPHVGFRLGRNVNDYLKNRVGKWGKEGDRFTLDSIFKQGVSHLYPDYLKLPGARVTICTNVQWDGLGDWGHAIETASILTKGLNSPHTSLVCSFRNLEKRRGALTVLTRRKVANEVVVDETFKDSKNYEIANTAFKSAELVVQVALGAWDSLVRGIEIPSKKPCLGFSEYGLMGQHVLGFGPEELGIEVPMEEIDTSSLQDSALNALLEERSNSSFYFGYLKIAPMQSAFVALCCALAQADVDVICPLKEIPKSGWGTGDWLDVDTFGFVLRSLGVKELSLYGKNEEGKLILKEKYTLRKNGKKSLRLINPFPLSSEDFRLLAKRSQLFTGCTGDLSFAGAFPRIPFYEEVGHKHPFFNSFLEVVEEHLGKESPLFQFFQRLQKVQGFKDVEDLFKQIQGLAEVCRNPKIETEIEDLTDFIRKHYNFNRTLVDVVSREIALLRYPSLQKEESALLEQFLQGKKPFSLCYQEIKKILASFKEV